MMEASEPERAVGRNFAVSLARVRLLANEEFTRIDDWISARLLADCLATCHFRQHVNYRLVQFTTSMDLDRGSEGGVSPKAGQRGGLICVIRANFDRVAA